MLVDIDGNIEHHRLNFLFILQKNKNRSKHTCSIILGLLLQILVAALKFFLGHEKVEDGDSDSDDEVRLIESNSGIKI